MDKQSKNETAGEGIVAWQMLARFTLELRDQARGPASGLARRRGCQWITRHGPNKTTPRLTGRVLQDLIDLHQAAEMEVAGTLLRGPMGTAISFPYNQTVQAFTPTSGTYENVTFVICCTSNGLGAGQLQPVGSSSDTSTNTYQSPIPFPEGIDADGGSNTALCFLFNAQNYWINQNPPYYFVLGSASKNLWLYSLTPAAGGESFTSSNIQQLSKIDDFDTAVSSIYFYASLNLLFVAGSNGNLYTFQVSWNSTGEPTFSYQGANENYTSPTGCAVAITFFFNSTLAPTAQTSSNPYIPAGTYNTNSSDISIKISAQCLNTSGTLEASSVSYSLSDAANITEIENNDGVLTVITTGSSAATSSASAPTNLFGSYVPAGSYQETSSQIWVEITATCTTQDGSTSNSTLSYPAEAANTIVDLANNDGQLILITPVFLVITGLCEGSNNGAFYFPVSMANNGVLPNALGMISHTQDSVATVVSQTNQTIYTATQDAIIAHPFNDLQGGNGSNLWSASSENELILSMVGVANPQNLTYQGRFSQGALVVGTVANTSSATNTTPGNLYAIDPSISPAYVYTMASASNSSDLLTGSPFSLFADNNYHLLVNFGATGLLLYDLPSDNTTAGGNQSCDPVNLIPNETEQKQGWIQWLIIGLVLAACIVLTVASGGSDAGVDAAAADVIADDAEADAAESAMGDAGDSQAADGDSGAEGGGDGDGSGQAGGQSSSDSPVSCAQNQGGTWATYYSNANGATSRNLYGRAAYPYYINGNVLNIPGGYPQSVFDGIISQFENPIAIETIPME